MKELLFWFFLFSGSYVFGIWLLYRAFPQFKRKEEIEEI